MTIGQAVSVALLYWVFTTTIAYHTFFTSFAYIYGFMIGIIMGDWKTGLILGAMIQTLNMAPVTTGATITYDLRTAAFVGVPIAMALGLDAEQALALAIPFAALGVFFTPIERTINSLCSNIAVKGAEEGNEKKITLANVWLPPILNFPLRFISMFVVLYYGQNAISMITEGAPQWLLHGFSVMGGMLPAIGFALFLQIMGKKSVFPYFFLGFYMSHAFGLPTIVMAVFGTVFAVLHITFTGTNTANEGGF